MPLPTLSAAAATSRRLATSGIAPSAAVKRPPHWSAICWASAPRERAPAPPRRVTQAGELAIEAVQEQESEAREVIVRYATLQAVCALGEVVPLLVCSAGHDDHHERFTGETLSNLT